MKKEVDRNYFIDFLKFIFSTIIVFYHSWLFTGVHGNGYFNRGYLAVDFYFIVSGWLFINSIEKMMSKKPRDNIGLLDIKFIWKKIKAFLPNLIFIMVVGYFLTFGRHSIDNQILFSDSTISELLLLGVLGNGMVINSSVWYISAMLIIFFILFPIVYKYRKTYNYYIAPIIIVMTLAFASAMDINMSDAVVHKTLFINGMYKGLVFINLGVIAYEITQYMKGLNFNKSKRIIITIVEVLIYLAVFFNMHYELFERYLTGVLFMIAVAITFSNLSYTSYLFKWNGFEKLGKFGFILYLNNMPVRNFLIGRYSFSYKKMLIIYWGMVLILSVISYILSEVVIKKISNIKRKC